MQTRVRLAGLACVVLGGVCLGAGQAAAPAAMVEFKDDRARLSYAIGCQIATNLKQQQTEYDLPMLIRGISDVLTGQSPSLDELQIRQLIMAWQKQVQQARLEARKELAQKNLTEGKAFLAANGKKEGVKSLPSGLQYMVIKEGTGDPPTLDDTVSVHYKGSLIDGTEFDSSYSRGQPAEFPLRGVIKGWAEALQFMRPGSHYKIFIPPDLAYGEGGSGPIGPNAVLVFEVELLEVKKSDPNKGPNP